MGCGCLQTPSHPPISHTHRTNTISVGNRDLWGLERCMKWKHKAMCTPISFPIHPSTRLNRNSICKRKENKLYKRSNICSMLKMKKNKMWRRKTGEYFIDLLNLLILKTFPIDKTQPQTLELETTYKVIGYGVDTKWRRRKNDYTEK